MAAKKTPKKAVRKRVRKRKISDETPEEKAREQRKVHTVSVAAKKKAYLKLLAKNNGLYSLTAKQLGVSRKTPENWRRSDPEFLEACLTIQTEKRDFVEGKLLQNIDGGNVQAQIFYLKCKGRGRDVPDDWVERHEVAGAPDAPLIVNHNVKEVRDEVSDKALLKAFGVALSNMPELADKLKSALDDKS